MDNIMHGQNIKLNPYLTFDGNCRIAMEFYKEVLHGELKILEFSTAPMDVPDSHKDKVLHATLTFGVAVLMASDSLPDIHISEGNNNHLSIAAPTVEEGERIFNELSDGGIIIMAWDDTFWHSKFGMFIDKFGMHWMVNSEVQK